MNLSGTSINDESFLEFVLQRAGERRRWRARCVSRSPRPRRWRASPRRPYFMRELKARGCRFSLDDFGSGVSSFVYLKTLPVDFLKIDGHFVAHVATDAVDRSMVEAIAKIGRAMQVATIAEKVESAEVLEVLKHIGVDYIQGFHLAEPRHRRSFGRGADDTALGILGVHARRREHEPRFRWESKKNICSSIWPRATWSPIRRPNCCNAASTRRRARQPRIPALAARGEDLGVRLGGRHAPRARAPARKVVEVAADYGIAPIAASTHPFARPTAPPPTDHERYAAHRARSAGRRAAHDHLRHARARRPRRRRAAHRRDEPALVFRAAPAGAVVLVAVLGRRRHGHAVVPAHAAVVAAAHRACRSASTSYGEFRRHLDALVRNGLIEDTTKIWWDIRPSSRYPTLETRVFDCCTHLDDAVCLAALICRWCACCTGCAARTRPGAAIRAC